MPVNSEADIQKIVQMTTSSNAKISNLNCVFTEWQNQYIAIDLSGNS